MGQGGTAATGRLRRTAEVAKAGVATGRQALALYGPTKESALVTEAHALRYAK